MRITADGGIGEAGAGLEGLRQLMRKAGSGEEGGGASTTTVAQAAPQALGFDFEDPAAVDSFLSSLHGMGQDLAADSSQGAPTGGVHALDPAKVAALLDFP